MIGQVAVTQAVLSLCARAAGLVFVGSVGGRLAAQFAGPYHASKFAIEAIADVWRQELEPEALSVVLIEPSAISTPIWDKAIERIDALVAAVGPAVATAIATASRASARACAARTSTARRRTTSRRSSRRR